MKYAEVQPRLKFCVNYVQELKIQYPRTNWLVLVTTGAKLHVLRTKQIGSVQKEKLIGTSTSRSKPLGTLHRQPTSLTETDTGVTTQHNIGILVDGIIGGW